MNKSILTLISWLLLGSVSFGSLSATLDTKAEFSFGEETEEMEKEELYGHFENTPLANSLPEIRRMFLPAVSSRGENLMSSEVLIPPPKV